MAGNKSARSGVSLRSSQREAPMPSKQTIRPVSYEEKPGTFRVVNDAEGMGRALLTYCKPDDPSFRRAAKSCLWLEHGDLEPEEVRADFVQALTSAGVFVRDP